MRLCLDYRTQNPLTSGFESRSRHQPCESLMFLEARAGWSRAGSTHLTSAGS